MADSDSEIVFNRGHNHTEMEDKPGTDTEELDQQHDMMHTTGQHQCCHPSTIYLTWKTPLNKSHNQDILWRVST